MSGRHLAPWLLQVTGLAIVIGAAVFWAVTGRQSALIVGAGMSLTGLGIWNELRVTFEEREDDAPDEGRATRRRRIREQEQEP